MSLMMVVSQPVLVVQFTANLLPHLTEGVKAVVYLLQVPVLFMHDLLQGNSNTHTHTLVER